MIAVDPAPGMIDHISLRIATSFLYSPPWVRLRSERRCVAFGANASVRRVPPTEMRWA